MRAQGRSAANTSCWKVSSGGPRRLAAPLALAVIAAAGGLARPAAADDDMPLDIEVEGFEDEAPSADTSWLIPPEQLRFEGLGLTWKVGGYVTYDSIVRGRNTPGKRNTQDFSNVRPIVEAWDENLTMRFEGDALGLDTADNVYEAWVSWQASRTAPRFTIGQFKVALGSEFGTSDMDLPYIGYGFTSQFTGRHDVGVKVDGTLVEGIWYQAAAVAGHGFDLEGQRLETPQTSLRVEIAPFQIGNPGAESAGGLQGLHIGAAYAHRGGGDMRFLATTPLEQRIFQTGKIDTDGGHWVHLGAGWSSGPFQLGFEKAFGSIDGVKDRLGVEHDYDEMSSYSYFLAWNMTGEQSGWRDGTWATGPCPGPRTCDFLPQGKWELSARFSAGTFARDWFNDGIAAYDGGSTWQAHTYSLALFWEPTHNSRIGFGMAKTVTEDEIDPFGFDDGDTTFVLRVELKF